MQILTFWKPEGENGYLSQWYQSSFYDGPWLYYSTEQYMMAKKAELFDPGKVNDIMIEPDPKKIRALGRWIENFDQNIWDEEKMGIVVTGNYLKFLQNKSIRKQLLETEGCILAEASPYDKIWGTGFCATETINKNPQLWGQNLLGKSLMTVRRILSL